MENIGMGNKILVIGSAVIDVIIRIAALPNPGDDIVGHKEGHNVGGCAYNVSKILDYLKIEHDLCVPVGQGMYADIIKNTLMDSHHDILIEDSREDNGYSISLVEDNGERTFITVDGIETKWQSGWFKNLAANKYDYIYVSGYGFQDSNTSGDIILEFLKGKRPDCHLVLDPGPRLLGSRFRDELLRMNTILELNEHEAQEMSGEMDIKLAAKKLHAATENTVIITLGQNGTLCHTAEGQAIIKGRPVKAIDTIGAGDSHTAGFIAGLANGKSIADACKTANEIAGKVVQKIGCNV